MLASLIIVFREAMEAGLIVGVVLAATKGVVPLSKLAGDRLAELRKWAEGRARRASSPEDNNERQAIHDHESAVR